MSVRGNIIESWKVSRHATAMDEAFKHLEEQGIDMVLAKSMWTAWIKIDRDQTGQLDSVEAQNLLSKFLEGISQIDLGAIFAKYDKNQDNSIDFEEFVNIVQDISDEQGIAIGTLLLRANLIDDGDQADEKTKFPKALIIRFLKKEIEQMDACLQLIPTLLLFIVFLTSFILHESPSVVHMQQKSIHFDLNENANFAFGGAAPFDSGRMGHKSLFDLNSMTDFWSWMSMGFCPLIFHDSWDLNEVFSTYGTQKCSNEADLLRGWGWIVNSSPETAPPSYCSQVESIPQSKSEQGMYLLYHRVLGGLRLQQELADVVECSAVPDGLRTSYGMPCYSSPYYLNPDVSSSFVRDETKVNLAGAETQWFRVPSSLADVRLKLRELEQNMWFRQATQRVEVALPTYNAIEGTLTMTYIHIFVTRGGRFFKQVAMGSVWLDVYHSGAIVYVVDIIWGFATLRILITEAVDIIQHCRNLGLKQGISSYMSFWNFVDWVTLAAGIGIFICLGFQGSMMSDLRATLEEYDYRIPGGFNDGARTEEMFTDIEDAVKQGRVTRIFFGFYAFAIGLRFFKAFAAQSRLAIVTATMTRAAVDIIHFGLVFFLTIAMFAASAMALFGHELEEFSTLPRALAATMRCLLGDFEWEAMKEVGSGLASAWFWAFQIFAVNIMFNMILAIIMDTYSEVKSRISLDAETLWSQSYSIWRRWRQKAKGERLGLDHVLQVLIGNPLIEPPDLYQELTAQDLCEQVKGLQMNQALRLFKNTDEMIKEEQHVHPSLEHALEKLSTLESLSKAMFKGLEIMVDTPQAHETQAATNGSPIYAEPATRVNEITTRTRRSLRRASKTRPEPALNHNQNGCLSVPCFTFFSQTAQDPNEGSRIAPNIRLPSKDTSQSFGDSGILEDIQLRVVHLESQIGAIFPVLARLEAKIDSNRQLQCSESIRVSESTEIDIQTMWT